MNMSFKILTKRLLLINIKNSNFDDDRLNHKEGHGKAINSGIKRHLNKSLNLKKY